MLQVANGQHRLNKIMEEPYHSPWPTRLKRFLVGLQVTWDVILVIPHYHELSEMLRGWL